MNIIDRMSIPGLDKEALAKEVMEAPQCMSQLLDGLNNRSGSIRLGCEKILRYISEQQPELIYPHFDAFVKLLDSENNILRWGAIITISNLVSVDAKDKFEKIFKKYFAPITDTNMITASNIIKNSWKIVLAKPQYTKDITREILKAEYVRYENKGKVSPECNNIVCGHVIDSVDIFYHKITDKKPVISFVKSQLNNTRKAVAKKADKFIKKYNIGL
jgi:hypothetical protein